MIYLFLAEGFEEIEALTPVDLLRRAGAEVTVVSVNDAPVVFGSHRIGVLTDKALSSCEFDDAEMLVLPGGMPGTLNLGKCERLCSLLKEKAAGDTFIAAICAAPSVLGKLGLLKGKKAVCYPGFESSLTGAEVSVKKVVRDGNVITAAGMGVALDFGLELVSALFGSEKAEELRKSVIAR
ncbi:MAG: DJ-1/PfpI family protein [Clostridia bacterium]|nr:DJ-1/PfpI family protein [Clostridia bacterium]